MSQASKISIKNVSLSLGGKKILDQISAEIPVGKKSVLIGPAASGKTVLFKCIAGIHTPDTGSIEVDSKPVPKAGSSGHSEFMLNVGMLFQQGGLLDSLKVWENITFRLTQVLGVNRAEARDIAIQKLAMVNLSPMTADLLPSELSGGMQKRVGVARALAGDPSLLLLDEPTAGLDPITTNTINKMISRNMQEIGATVLAITSDMNSARNEYDYLFMLNQGALVWHGPTSEIDNSGNEYVLQLINGRADGPIKMRIEARAS